MLHDIVKKGSVDRSVTLRIIDSTDGTPETGVVWNTAGIDLWYRREGAAVVSITEATLAALTTAHTDGGFLTISHGYYRLDIPDAAFATGANHVDFGGTVTGMVVIGGRVRLVDYDPEDTVRMGLTSLPASGTLAVNPILNATQTGVTIPTVTAVTNDVGITQAGADKVWGTAARTLTSFGTLVADVWAYATRILTANTNFNDPTASVIADAVWDELVTGHDGVGKAGAQLWTDIDAIAVDVAGLDGAAMRGTDSAALASVCTEGRLAELDAANLPTDVAARATPAQVNAEVLDVLNVDTFAEPAQGAPAATTTLVGKIGYLYKAWRNRNTQTASQYTLYGDDALTVDQKASYADNGTTSDRAEIGAGP